MLFMEDGVWETAGLGAACKGEGPERLNADFISSCGDATLGRLGAATGDCAGAGAGDDMPNKS